MEVQGGEVRLVLQARHEAAVAPRRAGGLKIR